jgi:hypothetical protein
MPQTSMGDIMRDSKRVLVRFVVPLLFAAAAVTPSVAQSAPGDEEIANGLDPITLGQASGNYAGGTLIAGEYCPRCLAGVAQATDEEIANGLDPITTGQEIGNFPGGTVLADEHVPYPEPEMTAERKP